MHSPSIWAKSATKVPHGFQLSLLQIHVAPCFFHSCITNFCAIKVPLACIYPVHFIQQTCKFENAIFSCWRVDSFNHPCICMPHQACNLFGGETAFCQFDGKHSTQIITVMSLNLHRCKRFGICPLIGRISKRFIRVSAMQNKPFFYFLPALTFQQEAWAIAQRAQIALFWLLHANRALIYRDM